MRIGIHTSTSGALENSAVKAQELGANTFQIFSSSPRMWKAKEPDAARVKVLRELREAHDLTPLVIHDSYLINLCCADEAIRAKSIAALTGEMERALLIGAEYLVAHPGNYRGLAIEQGLFQVAEAVAMAWRAVSPALRRQPKLKLLFENTAGAGSQLGGDLRELAALRQLVVPFVDLPVGYCLDTCHLYVYGRDISSEHGLEAAVTEAEEILGLEHVPVLHANDAKTKLGSHLDRHANIGEGYIGKEGFRRLLNHPRLRDKAFILETPVDTPGDDLRNVNALKELILSPNKRLTTRRSKRSGTSDGKTISRST